MFNNKDGKSGSIKGWFERRREEKEKREAMELLNLRLNTADGLYNMALDLSSRENRADHEEALKSALVACNTYKEAIQYDKVNYKNLFICQRLIASICWNLGDHESSYKFTRNAIISLEKIMENKLAKGHEYVNYFGIYYDMGIVCANMKRDKEAVNNYYNYINKMNYILQSYSEDMTQFIAEHIRESARMLSLYREKYDFKEFGKAMIDVHHILTNFGNKYFTLASDVANYYALSDYLVGEPDYAKSMDMINNNYKQIRQLLLDGKTYDKIYFDLVFTACNLQSLFRESKNIEIANKLSDVVVRFLPKAMETFEKSYYQECMLNVNNKYNYIIDTMKNEYTPTLPAEKKQAVMKTLDFCQNSAKIESFADYDI